MRVFIFLEILLSVAALSLFDSGANAQSALTWIGKLTTDGITTSTVYGISADGSTVVGRSDGVSGYEEPFRWTRAGGMVSLGGVPGGTAQGRALAVSADGSVIVGSTLVSFGLFPSPFRWTSSGGMVNLGVLSSSGTNEAFGVSDDGETVFGVSGLEGFRWTDSGGMVGLGGLGGPVVNSSINAVSSDGQIAAGYGWGGLAGEPARWTSATGMVGIGALGGGGPGELLGRAHGISADGSTIVGSSTNTNGDTEAFRWTSASGIVGLGFLGATNNISIATDTSADGSIVVGYSRRLISNVQVLGAFIWDASDGMRTIEDVLANSGVDLDGATLYSVWGISDDGKTLTGGGRQDGGFSEGWVAELDGPVAPSVPAVGPIGLLCVGGLLLASGAWRLRRSQSAG